MENNLEKKILDLRARNHDRFVVLHTLQPKINQTLNEINQALQEISLLEKELRESKQSKKEDLS